MEPASQPRGTLLTLPALDDDAKLVEQLQQGHAAAAAKLYDRFSGDVNRLVWRLLGADSEHDDVVQQVFLAAWRSVGSLRDPSALRGWMVSITVNTVRSEIRRRRWRRLVQLSGEREPLELTNTDDHAGRAALASVYRMLERIPTDERLAFVLRYVEGQALEEVAEALACSLATAKRRLKRAEERFVRLAARDPALAECLQTSTRWTP